MWERRYGFPSPARSDSGLRAYSEADVERLRLIAKAIGAGYRPREVVAASPARLRAIAEEAAAPAVHPARTAVPVQGPGGIVARALAALAASDVATMERLLRERGAALPAKRFVADVAAPLVRAVGEAWERGELEVRHEHLFSEILTVELHAMRARCQVATGAPRALLATLPEELHGLGIEMVALYLAAAGIDVLVLGVNAPPLEIARAARSLNADAVGLSISASSASDGVGHAIDQILPELPRRVPLWLGGAGAERLRLTLPGVEAITSWPALDAALARLRLGRAAPAASR